MALRQILLLCDTYTRDYDDDQKNNKNNSMAVRFIKTLTSIKFLHESNQTHYTVAKTRLINLMQFMEKCFLLLLPVGLKSTTPQHLTPRRVNGQNFIHPCPLTPLPTLITISI